MAQARSTSRKSPSDLKPPPRLKRTLKRKPVFRDLTGDDIKYVWAAYKKGAISQIKEGLNPADFKGEVTSYLLNNYHYHWVFENKKGDPIGLFFGVDCRAFILAGDAIWFPWATSRNKVESMVNFFNEIKNYHYLVGYCDEKDKKFFVHIAKHGIIRRVGTLQGIHFARLWETC